MLWKTNLWVLQYGFIGTVTHLKPIVSFCCRLPVGILLDSNASPIKKIQCAYVTLTFDICAQKWGSQRHEEYFQLIRSCCAIPFWIYGDGQTPPQNTTTYRETHIIIVVIIIIQWAVFHDNQSKPVPECQICAENAVKHQPLIQHEMIDTSSSLGRWLRCSTSQTNVRLSLAHESSFGQMPLQPPPVTHSPVRVPGL